MLWPSWAEAIGMKVREVLLVLVVSATFGLLSRYHSQQKSESAVRPAATATPIARARVSPIPVVKETRTPHAWVYRDSQSQSQFEFSVDVHADGHHSYSARLINLPFPCPNQSESGSLTSQEWAELKLFQPKTVSQQLDCGTLERNGLTVKLSPLDWAALANSAAGKAEHRLVMKAKAL